MREPRPSRAWSVCILVLLVTALALFGLDRFGRGNRVFGRVGSFAGRDVPLLEVEGPKEAYLSWRQAGYRGRTLVFIADRWESFVPSELLPADLFQVYPLQLYKPAALLEENIDGVTFLYIASLNSICRGIVALVPQSEVDRVTEQARKSKDYRVTERGLYLSREGFPRWFTTGPRFAGLPEPALIYVGASYFRFAEPEELYRQLSAAGLKSDSLLLSREAGKKEVTSREIAKLRRFAELVGAAGPATPGREPGTAVRHD